MFIPNRIEINNAQTVTRPDMDNATKRKYAEVCSSLVFGKTISSELNALKDKVANYLKTKGAEAAAGNVQSACEINSVLTLMVEPPMLQAMSLYGFLGNYHELAYDQVPEVEVWQLKDVHAREQAYNGDVPFGTHDYVRYPVATTTISGGTQVDYRELAMGNFDSKLADEVNWLMTDMNNKAMAYIIDKVFEALKNNTENVKYYTEYTGDITPDIVDDMVTKMRRMGKTSIIGDYSVIAQVSGWAGHQTVAPSTVLPFYSEDMVKQMQAEGKLDMYKGSNLVEIPNPYNMNAPLADKSGWETYYDPNRTLVLPVGMDSPVNIFRRGGITTMVGTDVKTGRYLTRYDMEIGCDVARGMEYKIGALVKTGE